jgi:hypothetical protein
MPHGHTLPVLPGLRLAATAAGHQALHTRPLTSSGAHHRDPEHGRGTVAPGRSDAGPSRSASSRGTPEGTKPRTTRVHLCTTNATAAAAATATATAHVGVPRSSCKGPHQPHALVLARNERVGSFNPVQGAPTNTHRGGRGSRDADSRHGQPRSTLSTHDGLPVVLTATAAGCTAAVVAAALPTIMIAAGVHASLVLVRPSTLTEVLLTSWHRSAHGYGGGRGASNGRSRAR